MTVHYALPTATDEHGTVFGPTACGIDAGTYATYLRAVVTCPDCRDRLSAAECHCIGRPRRYTDTNGITRPCNHEVAP